MVALCVLLARAFRPLLRYRPTWAKSFIEEPIQYYEIPGSGKKWHHSRSTMALLAVVPLGLTLQVLAVLFPSFDQAALLLVLAWVRRFLCTKADAHVYQATATLLLAVDRPVIAPVGLLAIIISILASHFVLLIKSRSDLHIEHLPALFQVILGFCAIFLIVCMPLRDPRLPSQDISPAYAIPTHQLRSPEDNLSLWQFMTVSWMSPLISLGSARQLNDEDVWSLSLEFQHRGLHEQVRELKGSDVGRLLVANGIDLV